MRLLHVVPTYLPATRYGGPITSVHELCKALAAKGHDVHVFTTNVDGEKESDVVLGEPVELDGVSIWYFRSTWPRRLYYAPAMLRALKSQATSFDIIHLHSIFLWPTWAAARTARRFGIPYLLSPRGMLVKDLILRRSRAVKTVWLYLIERNNLEKASAIHVTSSIEAREVGLFGFRLPRVVNIPNGVNGVLPGEPATRRESEEPKQGTPVLLFLGRINWKKGLDRLIPAMVHVQNAVLLVAGNDEEGYQAPMERLVAQYGLQDRVKFIGFVGPAKKETLLLSASLLVLPSYSENFGNVVLEALAHGCPVLVTPEVGAAEIVMASGGGAVTDGAPETLSVRINELLSKPTRLREMADAGRYYVMANCTWNAVAARMETAYRKTSEQIAVSRSA